MAGKKYQSCLIPFENEIVDLRLKRPPMPYSQIAEYLKEKHKISVCRHTILGFLKRRAKGFESCKYAECIKLASAENQSATEVSRVSTVQKASKPPAKEKPAMETPELEIKPFEMEFSETYNLTRMSPEEAAIKNKIIEEKIRAKYYPNKQQKEKQ